jgi:SAM-dependent methyltransferase
MSFDANAYRDESLEAWEASASGWARHQTRIQSMAAPVSQAMIEAVEPQPGQRVLELAAGLGETGLLAAELVAPGGTVVISDQAEAMLAGARERAAELGIENVEFKVLNAEWIDEPLASFDAALCRFGYMLMADPAAALAETRRVLRPGGVVALAVWDELARNPWAALPREALRAHGLGSPPQPGAPGPFALGDRERLLELIEDAGFAETEIVEVPIEQRYADFEEMWEIVLDISPTLHDAVMALPAAGVEEVRGTLRELVAQQVGAEAPIVLPGRVHVARASA